MDSEDYPLDYIGVLYNVPPQHESSQWSSLTAPNAGLASMVNNAKLHKMRPQCSEPAQFVIAHSQVALKMIWIDVRKFGEGTRSLRARILPGPD
jgi:hypothetical protein